MLGTLHEIWTLRHFWLALAGHDIKERYRRSFVGIAWSLIKPAAMTLILTVIFSNVFDVSVREYAPFLFLGLVTWQFFTESILQGCNAFRLGRTYLRVRPLPLAIFPLRVVLSSGIHALIGLAAATVWISILRGGVEPLALLSLLPAMLILALVAWSLACICAILHTKYSDTQQVAEISLQVLFYATPVIYLPESVHKSGWLYWLIESNPFAAFLELIRGPLLNGSLPSPVSLLIAAGFLAAMAGIAGFCVRRAQERLVLWL